MSHSGTFFFRRSVICDLICDDLQHFKEIQLLLLLIFFRYSKLPPEKRRIDFVLVRFYHLEPIIMKWKLFQF